MRISCEEKVRLKEPYRRLNSRQSSLKKHLSTTQTNNHNQTHKKVDELPIQSNAFIPHPVEVSEFQLAGSRTCENFGFKLVDSECHQYGSPEFHREISKLQQTLGREIFQIFTQEFVNFKQSLQNNSKVSALVNLPSNETKHVKAPLNHGPSSEVFQYKRIQGNQSGTNQNKRPKTQQDQFAHQVPFVSFRKLQDLSNNQIVIQQPKSLPQIQKQFDQGKLVTEPLQENMKTESSGQSQENPYLQTFNSPLVSLSPDQKEFRRSFKFTKSNLNSEVKNQNSELGNENVEISLLSTENNCLNAKRLAKYSILDVLYDELEKGKFVMVVNKLLFMREK